jgi:hypothetical protein
VPVALIATVSGGRALMSNDWTVDVGGQPERLDVRVDRRRGPLDVVP